MVIEFFNNYSKLCRLQSHSFVELLRSVKLQSIGEPKSETDFEYLTVLIEIG